MKPKPPRIIYGAVLLATLSLAWSAYAITDLMQSGPFGLSVALAGDIGWITVLWAEYKRLTICGKGWPAPLTGWSIAISVAGLLVLHGIDAGSTPQAIAGPFVVLVGKTVWTFALAAMRDPAGPTPEQQDEINALMRDAAHQAAVLHARADGEIARIRAEASITLARDDADFEIGLERLNKRAELHRRTPIALPEAQPAEPVEPKAQSVAEPPAQPAEPQTPGAAVVVASSQAVAPEPAVQPDEPEALTFGFSAHLSAQSAQRAKAVAQVAELLAQDSGLTSAQVAEELSVSPATAKRYLREARQVRP